MSREQESPVGLSYSQETLGQSQRDTLTRQLDTQNVWHDVWDANLLGPTELIEFQPAPAPTTPFGDVAEGLRETFSTKGDTTSIIDEDGKQPEYEGVQHYVHRQDTEGPTIHRNVLATQKPYPVLLDTEIIVQRATVKGKTCTHYPHRDNNLDPLTGEKLYQPGSVKPKPRNMYDDVPSTVIRVIGNVKVEQFLSVKEAGAYATQQNTRKEFGGNDDKGGYARYVGGEDENDVKLDDGDDQSANEKKRTLMFIKQYLARSIPSVAAANATTVVCNGKTYISSLVGRGASCQRTMGDAPLGKNMRTISVTPRTGGSQEAAPDTNFTHNFFVIDKEYVAKEGDAKGVLATPESVSRFVKDMLSELSHTPTPNEGKPARKGRSMVIYVLVGGVADACQTELLHAVKKQWPIFIIEDSTGYAEHLSNVIRRIEQVCIHPSMDDYRAMLGSGDAATAEILINGNVHLVGKGTSAEEFSRILDVAMHDDDTLLQAWRNYATWKENADLNHSLMNYFQMIILLFGILATTMSILMTFFQLQFPEETVRNSEGTQSLVTQIYTWGNLALIALPILSSLLQAILIQLNPGGKWACLRRCSELMLREIFMYRTSTRKYSIYEIAKSQQSKEGSNAQSGAAKTAPSKAVDESGDGHQDNVNGSDDDDDADDANNEENMMGILDAWADTEPYYSRSDLLYRRIQSLTDDVLETLSNTAMKEYTGPLPPPNITVGDDGFSDLGPDEYSTLRLETAKAFYEESSEFYGRRVSHMTILVYSIGAAGTLLAAIAVYGDTKQYNLQAWVALTTSIQNALSRYVDYSRIEYFHKEHTRAKELLSNVMSWWAQLQQPGMSTDSQHNRNTLVGKVEMHITREVEESGSQMKSMMEKMKKAQDQQEEETNNMTNQLRSGEELAKEKAVKQMGLQALNSESIAAAISDPNGPEAKELQKTLNRLNEQIDAKPLVEEALGEKRMQVLEQQAARVKTLGEDVVDAAGKLKDGNLGGLALAELLPMDIVNMINDPMVIDKLRVQLGQFKTGHVTRHTFLALAGTVKKEFLQRMSSLPHRQMLTTMRRVLMQRMLQDFENALASIDICLYDLIDERSMSEELLGELQTVSLMSWKTLEFQRILSTVKNDSIRSSLEALGEAKLRAVLRRATRFFADTSATTIMLETTNREIAELDVEEVFSNPGDFAQRAKLRESARKKLQENRMELLSKEQLLNYLPAKLRVNDDVTSKSALQLAKYVRHIAHGSLVSQCMDTVFRKIQQSAKQGHQAHTRLMGLLRSIEERERFFRCVVEFNAKNIYVMKKDAIIRELSVAENFTEDPMGIQLRELRESNLREIILLVKSVLSRSLPLQIFDHVADNVNSFDLHLQLPTVELRLALLNRLENFRGLISGEGMVVGEVMNCCGNPALVKRLFELSEAQLSELIFCLLLQVTNNYYSFVVHEFVKNIDGEDLSAIGKWTNFECQRVIHALRTCGYQRQWDPKRKVQLKDLSISDNVVWSLLNDLKPSTLQAVITQLCRERKRDTLGTLFFADISKLAEGNIPMPHPAKLLVQQENQLMLIRLIMDLNNGGVDGDEMLARSVKPMSKQVSMDHLSDLDSYSEALGIFPTRRIGDECVKSLTESIQQSLRFMAPMHVFNATAELCTTFDLRRVFDTVGLISQLMIAVFLWDGDAQHDCKRQVVEYLEEAEDEQGLATLFEDLLFTLRNFSSSDFDTFVENMRIVCEEDEDNGAGINGMVRQFIEDDFLDTSFFGRFLEGGSVGDVGDDASPVDFAPGSPGFDSEGQQSTTVQAANLRQAHDALHMRIAFVYLRQQGVRNSHKMRKALCDLDANLFVGTSEEERVAALQLFIPEQDTVVAIAKLEPEKIKPFFAELNLIKSMTIDVSSTLRLNELSME